MRIFKHLAFAGLMLALVASVVGAAQAQVPDAQFFSETGHWVKGPFWAFYQSVPEAKITLGFPITEELVDPHTGLKVQYFQRARLDLKGDQVGLAPLGELLYQAGAEPAKIASSDCRKFDNGLSVCLAFLHFYERMQGEIYFGKPVSNMEKVDGRLVQSFEYARFEYRPDDYTGQIVALSDLGTWYLNDVVRYQPPDDGVFGIEYAPSRIYVHAFVSRALLPSFGKQQVFIIVQDQKLRPVPNANIMVHVYYPGQSDPVSFRPEVTNMDGISILVFSIDKLPPKEIVRMEVSATFQTLEETSSTWFRIWW